MEIKEALSNTGESNQNTKKSNYLESLAQTGNNSRKQAPASGPVQPSFACCTPTLSRDELELATRKKKTKNKSTHMRRSCSSSNTSTERRRRKRPRSRTKKISRSKSCSRKRKKRKRMKRCRNKMCVKHARTLSIPNLLSDSPCGNKRCVKHASTSIPKFEEDANCSGDDGEKKSRERKRSRSLSDSPCGNKRCAKHASTSIPKFEEDVNCSGDDGGNKSRERKRSRSNPVCKDRTTECHADLDRGSNCSCTSESSSGSDSEDEEDCTSEEDIVSDQNRSSRETCRRKPKTIINRILEFLGLQRNRNSSAEADGKIKGTAKCPTCGSKLRRTSEFSHCTRAYVSTEGVTSSGKGAEAEKRQYDGVEQSVAIQSEANHNNECECSYCPMKRSEKLDLDNIMVTPECGNLISQAIRDMVYKEIESRLEGLEDHIVEEERQFWATYIPRDKCPRCCSSQQCDLHGSLGCVACFSHGHGKKC